MRNYMFVPHHDPYTGKVPESVFAQAGTHVGKGMQTRHRHLLNIRGLKTIRRIWATNTEEKYARPNILIGCDEVLTGTPTYASAEIPIDACAGLLCEVLPRIWDETKLSQSRRRTCRGDIGASIFLSMRASATGAHCDDKHTLLVCLRGRRTVYLTRQNDWPRRMRAVETALKPQYDPALGSSEGWKQYELAPGDAIFIPCRMWHSVVGEADSVALAIDVCDPFTSTPRPRLYHLTCKMQMPPAMAIWSQTGGADHAPSYRPA